MKKRSAEISTGIAKQITGDKQKFVEIKTDKRTFVLQEGEQGKYYISIERHKDNQIYEHKGPFEFREGLGNLMLCVIAEEGIAV